MRVQTIFDAIREQRKSPNEDFVENFEPVVTPDFQPTDEAPGSPEKIDVLCRRLEQGFPLFHEDDVVIEHAISGESRLIIKSKGHFDSRYVIGVLRKTWD
jgi:tRNA pseudouridine-54 N-methylase